MGNVNSKGFFVEVYCCSYEVTNGMLLNYVKCESEFRIIQNKIYTYW